jgi:UDP-N-acetylmuramoyl-tripeptide--D-alanyl-D-alanine ligase
MKFTSRESAKTWGVPSPGEFVMNGVAVDSRRVTPGCLFTALPGARVDGHEFVAEAFARGARAALVSRVPPNHSAENPLFIVPDTLASLERLAAQKRREAGFRLAAVTGSAGKTTTKEMTAAILSRRYRCGKTPGNANSLIGFPVSILNLDEGLEAVAGEMGMSHPGELSRLSRLYRPEAAAITNVSTAHRQNFESVEAIADAKWEITEGVPPGGSLIFNGEDERLARRAARFPGRKIAFGLGEHCEVSASGLRSEGYEKLSFDLRLPGESSPVTLRACGRHQVANFLCAAAIAFAWGFNATEIGSAAADIRLPARRGTVWKLKSGAILVDDSYNSSPAAVEAALTAFAEARPAGRRIAVLGDMLELGTETVALHRRIGSLAAATLDRLVCVGPLAAEIGAGAEESGMAAARVLYLREAAEVAPLLLPTLSEGDAVLVKGSRGVGLEVACEELKA